MPIDRKMPISKVTVLGGSGMLGNEVTRYLATNFPSLKITSTFRNSKSDGLVSQNLEYRKFEFKVEAKGELEVLLKDTCIVINCIGLIWQKSNSQTLESDFYNINYQLPMEIENLQKEMKFDHIHIGTDCVFNGQKTQRYMESNLPDAIDIYGVSKSLAEINLKMATILRCSVIGRSLQAKVSLLDWFLSHEENMEIKGYSNHFWNGIGTIQLARIIGGLILNPLEMYQGIQHIIPSDVTSKYDLLKLFATEFNRSDLKIAESKQDISISRVLGTLNPERNDTLWRNAGYKRPPSISDIVKEVSSINWMNLR